MTASWGRPESKPWDAPTEKRALGAIGSRSARLALRHRLVEAIDLACIVGFQSTRLAILALNGVVHLLAVY
jgi:hypothetical protein